MINQAVKIGKYQNTIVLNISIEMKKNMHRNKVSLKLSQYRKYVWNKSIIKKGICINNLSIFPETKVIFFRQKFILKSMSSVQWKKRIRLNWNNFFKKFDHLLMETLVIFVQQKWTYKFLIVNSFNKWTLTKYQISQQFSC